jgi:hypothetical protein
VKIFGEKLYPRSGKIALGIWSIIVIPVGAHFISQTQIAASFHNEYLFSMLFIILTITTLLLCIIGGVAMGKYIKKDIDEVEEERRKNEFERNIKNMWEQIQNIKMEERRRK